MRYVIIGTGAAGVTAARTIKRTDRGAEVVVIGEERFYPYNRYLLTEFLCGCASAGELFHTNEEFFEEMGIQLRKGQRVIRVYPAEKTIRFAHNEVMPFDKLLIATGRCHKLGPILRPFEKHIQRYYTFEDILLIQKRLPQIRDVVVSGCGLGALDLIYGMCRLGKKVTYVIRRASVEIPMVEAELPGELETVLADKGVEIIRQDYIVAVEHREDRYLVKTHQGRALPADMIFAFEAYQPNVEFLRGSGIEIKNGILVDLQMRTSAQDVFAAGDCVEIYHPRLKNYWINFGWPNAVEQGQIAGKNMAGLHEDYQIHETTVFNILGKPLAARWWA